MPDTQTQLVIETFVLGPYATNCYVVRTAGDPRCWIIDAGYVPEPLIESVKEQGLTPQAIILTHAHADHIAGLGEIKDAFPDAPILLHEAESAWLSDPELNLSASFGAPFTTPPADRLLTGDETLDLAGTSWKVIFTPGHSPGGVTLWSAKENCSFVGDTLFAGSIGRYDFPTCDREILFRSIRQTLYKLPEQTTVYPGHGPTTTIGVEKTTNPFVRA